MRGMSDAATLQRSTRKRGSGMWVLFVVAMALIFVLAAACGADQRRNNQERR
jgi:hypothetical protein